MTIYPEFIANRYSCRGASRGIKIHPAKASLATCHIQVRCPSLSLLYSGLFSLYLVSFNREN
jgi:hypothetical protein